MTAPTAPILIVEDDDDARHMLRDFLRAHGYEVHTSKNGRDALDVLKDIGGPCLIVLDLVMPVMNGWQFLAELKRSKRAAESAVIVLSAVADRGKHDGFPSMDKPADFTKLLRLVGEYCPQRAHA